MPKRRSIAERLSRCSPEKRIEILIEWLGAANDKNNMLIDVLDAASTDEQYESASHNLRGAIDGQHETLTLNLKKYFTGLGRDEFVKPEPTEQTTATIVSQHLWQQTITKEEFRQRGGALYGRNWQMEFSRATDTPVKTIQKWAYGNNPVPKWVSARLPLLEQAKK